MDIIKIMQDFPYPLTGTLTRASDWRHIRFGGTDAKEFEKPKEIISRILDEVGGEALTLMTMFGPFKAASFAFGDDELMFWAKEAPDDVAEGIKIIADGMTQWLQGVFGFGRRRALLYGPVCRTGALYGGTVGNPRETI